jgi:hypothetical protein
MNQGGLQEEQHIYGKGKREGMIITQIIMPEVRNHANEIRHTRESMRNYAAQVRNYGTTQATILRNYAAIDAEVNDVASICGTRILGYRIFIPTDRGFGARPPIHARLRS